MFAFLFKIILGIVCLVVDRWLKPKPKPVPIVEEPASSRRRRTTNTEEEDQVSFAVPSLLRPIIRVVGYALVAWAIIGTSVVWVKPSHFAILKRTYFGTSMPPGQIVALDGQLGPQARILTAGFHIKPLITLINQVDQVSVFTVPSGKCAILSAKDGLPPTGGAAFADPFPDATKSQMINDATYFLSDGKGQRGPQTSVLLPGSYTLNPHLWEDPELVDATRVEQGTVGVVKSSVRAPVDFGQFRREIPTNATLKVLTRERLPQESAEALLVPVGLVGVWEEPLPNGLFYINTRAYKTTMVPTTAQVYEYKGGYKRRTVQITVDDKGQIKEEVSESEVQPVPNTADTAISTQPEGWTVYQELRVIGQISPEMAPFVVASLGLTAENASQIVEDRVVTPIIRSVVRDVEGGTQIPIRQLRAVLTNGLPVLDTNGEPVTVVANEFRAVKVLDLIENRSSLEAAMEQRAKPEAMKEGVSIMEIRLSESAIPPELLIARKREQLAQQLTKAWQQEQIAQGQRQKTENARAQAEQQAVLVAADIKGQAAEQLKKARMTEAEGEKGYLLAIAEGQKAQSGVLGPEVTARLQMFQVALKAIEGIAKENPQLITTALAAAHKFVPEVQVINSGDSKSSGLEGPAAVLGHLLSKGGGDVFPAKTPTTAK